METNMANEELHERTLEVLAKVLDVLDKDDFSLLCWNCGTTPDEVMGNPKPKAPPIEPL